MMLSEKAWRLLKIGNGNVLILVLVDDALWVEVKAGRFQGGYHMS